MIGYSPEGLDVTPDKVNASSRQRWRRPLDLRALHELLYPLGPRQTQALLRLSTDDEPRDTLLALHTGVFVAMQRIVEAANPGLGVRDWLLLNDHEELADAFARSGSDQALVDRFAEEFLRHVGATEEPGPAYEKVASADLRHRLGEYYTPPWLVGMIAEDVAPGCVAADPSCGDGRFLVALINRGHDPGRLWGLDLNPLAVMFARYNVWRSVGRPELPPSCIEWGDFLLSDAGCQPWLPDVLRGATDHTRQLPPADHFVGNPPWVLWRNLSEGYRAAVAIQRKDSKLNHARGWTARVSAGQTDLAHLFIHDSIERTRVGGRITFVLPRSTFKSPVGASIVRSGRSDSGRTYCYEAVWDCSEVGVFAGVRSDAVVAFVSTDRDQKFPVRWEMLGTPDAAARSLNVLDAKPSDPDDLLSPWSTDGKPTLQLASGAVRASIRARGGVNTGGGNSVFYVRVVERRKDRLLVENLVTPRSSVKRIQAWVEADLVHPLLRGKDICAWRASPSGAVILPHGTDLRKPIPEEVLAQEAPHTLAYLSAFRGVLEQRRELARWGSDCWYSLFRIGPYTANCWRVVWPHSAGKNLRATLLTPFDRIIPDQKVVIAAFEDRDEALFYCALLNSNTIRKVVANAAGMDASPNLLRRVPLPTWDAADERHLDIVDTARSLLEGEPAPSDELDSIVEGLYVL